MKAQVSIPDRVLGFFRLAFGNGIVKSQIKFQSLIGF